MTATNRAGRADWLTVEQVCADLQVPEAEWHAWRAAGDTPLHIVMPDGQLRVRAADYARWLDTLAVTPTEQVSDDRADPSREASADASRPTSPRGGAARSEGGLR